MRNARHVVWMLVIVMLVIGCRGAQTSRPVTSGNDQNLPPALQRVLRDYERAWAAKDAAALAALFAEDGFVLATGHPPVRGRADIERHYQGAGGPLALRASAWRTRGDLAFIIGEYAADSSFANPGKFTLTLVRDDDSDRWLIFSDMDNGNTPPPRSSQAAPATAPAESPP